MLAGEEPLESNHGLYDGTRDTTCKICDTGQKETVTHFLFNCTSIDEQRSVFYAALCDTTAHAPTIIRSKDIRAVLRADFDVRESSFLYAKLRSLAKSIEDMYAARCHLM